MASRLTFLIGVVAVLFAAPAGAAELKVISAGAVRGLIAQILDDYSRETGQKFDFTIGTTGQLRDIIASGQPADLLIVSTPLMAELEKTGKFLANSRADLGRVGIGVALRDGPAAPTLAPPPVRSPTPPRHRAARPVFIFPAWRSASASPTPSSGSRCSPAAAAKRR